MIMFVPNDTTSKVLDCIGDTHMVLRELFAPGEFTQEVNEKTLQGALVPIMRYSSSVLEERLCTNNPGVFPREKFKAVSASLWCSGVVDENDFPFLIHAKLYKSFEEGLQETPKKLLSVVIDNEACISLESRFLLLRELANRCGCELYAHYQEDISLGDKDEKYKRNIFRFFISDTKPLDKPTVGVTINVIFVTK